HRDAAAQRALDERAAAADRPRIELELALEPRPIPRQHARREQLEHPAHILRGDEVQRPAHRPAADDAALRERALDVTLNVALDGGAHAQAHRPQRAEEILRLHRAEVRHDVVRRREVVAGQELAVQTAAYTSHLTAAAARAT